jgi:hypothetical protein
MRAQEERRKGGRIFEGPGGTGEGRVRARSCCERIATGAAARKVVVRHDRLAAQNTKLEEECDNN